MIRHNHVTRDIKPLGVCPACDAYHRTQPAVCVDCNRPWSHCLCQPAQLLPVRPLPPMRSLGSGV